MLESNTDRMWFVIGAILVGAVLIGGAQILFPDMMTLIRSKFTELLTNVSPPNQATPQGVITFFKTVPFI